MLSKQGLYWFLFLFLFLIKGVVKASDYRPGAQTFTLWHNNPSLPQIGYRDGSQIRVIFLRTVLQYQILSSRYGPAFACGFFCHAPCTSFYFSIVIVNASDSGFLYSDVQSPPVVWSANRDHPIKENGTLQFTRKGSLILRDYDQSLVWSAETWGVPAVSMQLTETGSLVLIDKDNATVWASYENPTDSWVLGQTLKEGQQLTANISPMNWTEVMSLTSAMLV